MYLENLGIAGERVNTLLDACAARVIQADDRDTELHRLVHHFADLASEGLGQRATEHGEVLREYKGRPTVDEALTSNDTIAGIL